MNPIEAAYEATADELTKRIIPAHPEIMTIESPFDLFKIDGIASASQLGTKQGTATAQGQC